MQSAAKHDVLFRWSPAACPVYRTFAALVLGLISFNQRKVFHLSFGSGKN